MRTINIAIDGPAGAGKSTISKLIANELSFIYIDTGALYRTVGLFAKRNDISIEQISDVVALLDDLQVDLRHEKGVQRVILNGEDVSDLIRTPEMSMYASAVSAVPDVRKALLGIQKEMAAKHDVLMDGRDIGTVVLPNAQIKLFLTADVEDRAKRRLEELQSKGEQVTFQEVLEDMKKRDQNDSTRAVAPLKPAADAIMVNTTGNTLEQSVAMILKIIKERLPHVSV